MDRQPLPEHVTLPLLTLITRNSLDEDYQHVADRKAAAGESPETPKVPRRRAALVVGLFGLLIVTAAVQTSRYAASTERGRDELVGQIHDRKTRLAEQERQISRMTRSVAVLQAGLDRVTAEEAAVSARVLRLRARTGYAPVTGPGVRFRVEDSPDGSSDGVVTDEDLATLVDGLWAAGAEAIAINGKRLSVLTGIRSTRRAINVQGRPLKPPYVVLAIGDPDTLQAHFAETSSGGEWFNLVANFGFEFDRANSGSLSLPARRAPVLRAATRLTDPDKETTP